MTELEILRRENADLRAELAQLRKIAAAPVIRRGLKLASETHAAMLARLWSAGDGRWVSLADLELDLPADKMVDENTVRVHVARLRGIIGSDMIETGRGRGYRLTAVGMTRIERLFANTGVRR